MERVRDQRAENQEKMLRKYLMGRMQNQMNFFAHPSYRLEQQLLHSITLGDWEQAQKTMEEINGLERAALAKDPTRSLRNSLICSCTLFTRAAIQGGVHPEDAFNLSDVYIRQIEETLSPSELEELEYEMLYSFIQRVQEGSKASYHWVVNKALEDIHEHLLEPASLQDMAQRIGVHPTYLSKQFHGEMGMTLIEYINRKKIEASQYFLRHSDSEISEIAVLFGFCNQSYYTFLFRKYVGITPKQYRMNRP